MNKFLTKVAKIFLGLSMAAGVGVAVSAGRKDASPAHGADSEASASVNSSGGTSSWTLLDGSDSIIDVSASAVTSYASQLRMAANSTLTFTPHSGQSIVMKTIRFKTNSTTGYMPGSGSTYTVDSGSATSFTANGSTNATLTLSKAASTSVVIKFGNAVRLTELGVTYGAGGGGSGGGDVITEYTDITAGDYNIVFHLANNDTDYYMTTTLDGSSRFTTSTSSDDAGVFSFESAGTNQWYVSCDLSGTKTYFKPDTSNGKTIKSESSTGMAMTAEAGTNGNIRLGTGSNYLQRNGTAGTNIVGRYNGGQRDIFKLISVASGFTVQFNVQGHGTAPANQTVSSGGKVTEPTAPTATGYTFGGWYKEAGCTNAWNFSTDTVSEATTLYAKWTINSYTVQFNVQGHGTAPSNQTIQHGGKVTQPSAPTATGYTFGGWYKEAACTNSWNFSSDTVTAATTIYAKWTADKYNINYYDEGGTAFSGTHASGYPTQHTYGTATTLRTATKDHYDFVGWYTESDCSGSVVTSLGATTYTAAINLYAKWTKQNYTIDDSNISNGSLSDTTDIPYNEELDVTIVPDTDYTYPSSIESVTMGGNPYNEYEYDSSNGSFRIEHVTGDVEITAHCVDTSAVPYTVDYSLSNCSITNAPETIYSNEIKELQIVPNDHYRLPLESENKVSVSGIDASKWLYDDENGTITISEPDANMSVSVVCILKAQNTISTGTLTGVSAAGGNPTSVEEGDTATLTFTADVGYGLPGDSGVSVTGTETYVWNQDTGELELLGETSAIIVSITGIQRDLTDGTLTLGSKKTAYTLGDDFELPATVVANFNIAPTTVDVKNDVEVSGPVTKNNDKYVVTGNGTVTLTYTYETTGTTQSASYPITAESITPSDAKYVKVTSTAGIVSGGKYLIVNEDATAAFNGTTDANSNKVVYTASGSDIATSDALTACEVTITYDSVNSRYTLLNSNGKYIGRTTSSNGLEFKDDAIYNTISFSDNNVSIRGLNGSSGTYYLMYNKASGTERFRYYNNNQETVQLYKYQQGTSKELKWITAELKTGTYYQGSTVNSSNFTVTAHYNGGNPQSEVVTENITVTNGYLANIGDNEVTLTYGGKSYNVNVVAVEQTATLTGLIWAQGEYTIIDGKNIDFSKFGTVTATYDIGGSSTKAISSCSVATYTKSNDTYTKVSDISDGATITSTSHGKYLGVTYTEKAVTKVAYSSAPIYVVESLQTIKGKVQQLVFDTQATDSNPIAIGDVIEFANVEALRELAGISTTSTKYGIAETYVSEPTGAYPLEVEQGSTAGTFSFKNGDLYLAWVSGNSLTTSVDKDASSSWTIDYNEDGIVITNVSDTTREIRYNDNNGSGQRFACYDNTKSSLPLIQVYKGETKWVPYGDSIANTNAVVQKAVLEFAEHFNDTMQCVNGGTTANVASKWSTLSTDFSTAMSGFTGDDLAHFKALFAYADSVESGDTLQDMLARYDYIVAKYKLSDFLNSAADRPEVAQSPNVSSLFNIIGENSNTIAIIVIISMVSVTAIGGYFFLRKKKEQ